MSASDYYRFPYYFAAQRHQVRPADANPHQGLSCSVSRMAVCASVSNIGVSVRCGGLVTNKEHHTIQLILDAKSWVTPSTVESERAQRAVHTGPRPRGLCDSACFGPGGSGSRDVPIFQFGSPTACDEKQQAPYKLT